MMTRPRLVGACLVALLGLTTAACESDGPLQPPGDSEAAATAAVSTKFLSLGGLVGGVVDPLLGSVSGLLQCQPAPYAAATKTIGPSGGTLNIGPHSLTIPTGALANSVVIRGEAPVGEVVSVKLAPEGLHFAPGREARLTLSYQDCPGAALVPLKRIVYTGDDLDLLAVLLTTDDVLRQRVSTRLKHFSRYAVAW